MNNLNEGTHTVVKIDNHKIRLSKKYIVEEIINVENNHDLYKEIFDSIKKPYLSDTKIYPVFIKYTIISTNTYVSAHAHLETVGGGKINITHLKNIKKCNCIII
tara:strand:- start:244 stop:555 length:312 start_codon:yes stop_codon:yes gene_type:complete